MEKYQIIPRKFRPNRFSEVAGHETVMQTLKNALRNQRVGQAYLFSGCRGCGKTTIARLLAKALNCANRDKDLEPCNACTSCLEIAQGQNLDVIEIDGASNRGIDDIRKINETIGYAPHQSPYKIYLIDEVHMLTKEAFNALLKTLEEPPERVKFFFATTEPHKIPSTITSRCQRFHLGRVAPNALVAKLKEIADTLNIEAETQALEQICALSEGSLRDAESLLDQLIAFGQFPLTLATTREVFGLIDHQTLFGLDEAVLTQNFSQSLQLASDLHQSGKDPSALTDSLQEHFRDHLAVHLALPHSSLYDSSKYTKEQCLSLLDTVVQWHQMMQKTTFKKLHLDMLFIDLVKNAHKVPLSALVQRLVNLEAKLQNAQGAQTPPPQEEQAVNTEPPAPIIPKEPVKKIEEPKPSIPETSSTETKETVAVVQEPIEPKAPSKSAPEVHPSKYDNLIRFAAVELEGFVKTK